MFKKIKNGDFHFNHPEFGQVSDECQNLIKQLLVVTANKRIDGKQALKHPWFEKSIKAGASKPLNPMVFEKLKQFRGVSQFKRACMNMLVKMASDEEVKELRNQFQVLDKDGSGMILAAELADVIKKQPNLNLTDQEI